MTKNNSELRRIDKKLAKAMDEKKKELRELTGMEKISDQQASESLFNQFQKFKLMKLKMKDVKF